MDILFQNFIDLPKWDEAVWSATAFLRYADEVGPPMLGIVFDNMEPAREIFTNWRKRLGEVDQHEELRISVIEGEILGKGPGYSVHISSNPEHAIVQHSRQTKTPEIETTILIGRINRMTPAPGSQHLQVFKRGYAKHRRYQVIPMSMEMGPDFDLAIEKTEIHFRKAGEITKSDLDSLVFPDGYFDVEMIQ